jgi:hypothetical protein
MLVEEPTLSPYHIETEVPNLVQVTHSRLMRQKCILITNKAFRDGYILQAMLVLAA